MSSARQDAYSAPPQSTVSTLKYESINADWLVGMSVNTGADRARRLVSLSGVVRNALPELRAAIADTAVLRVAIDALAPMVEVNPTAIQRALLKLVLNAAQAIRQPPGVIEIGVAGVIGSDGKSRPFVRLTVADNGIGMDIATVGNLVQQIAQPAVSCGAGLGLRIVHRAVCAHGGRLQFDSQPGVGTTVRIDLPAASQQSGMCASGVSEDDDSDAAGCRST
jgi:signal transduction histidine kinase